MIGSGEEKKGSDYISRVVESALDKLRAEEQRVNFAKALYMSIKLDLKGAPPQPCGPRQIQQETKFSIEEQRGNGIILTKEDAYDFLVGFGMTSLSKFSFKKKHQGKTLGNLFGRQVSKSNNNIVCTYAEWLHAANYLFEPQPPADLILLLPENWIPPCPPNASPIRKGNGGYSGNQE